jgi:hypothetical protein
MINANPITFVASVALVIPGSDCGESRFEDWIGLDVQLSKKQALMREQFDLSCTRHFIENALPYSLCPHFRSIRRGELHGTQTELGQFFVIPVYPA